MAIKNTYEATNTSIKLILYNFSEKDYDRTVKFFWSKDGKDWTKYVTKTIGPGETEVFGKKNGLEPGTIYHFRAEMTGQTDNVYEYGPFAIKTAGASYTEMTGDCAFSPYGSDIEITLSDVNEEAGYVRTVNLYYRKPGGAYILADSDTIPADSDYSTFYYEIVGLEEKTTYEVKVEVLNHLGAELKAWEDEITTDFESGGSLSISDITEKSCTLTVKNVPTSVKYPRSLKWFGKEGEDGTWEELTNTMAGSSNTYTLNSLYPLTYYEFKVEIYAGGQEINTVKKSCTTPEASGTLEETECTEYSAKVLLKGLATGVSYVRKIKWFYRTSTETDYTKYEKESTLSQSASSVAMDIDALASAATYSIKAEIYDTNDKLLGTKTIIVTTKETAAEISYGAVTAASIKLIVSGMNNASYTRTFEWYRKRQDEDEYVLFDKTDLPATNETGTAYKVIKPLIAKTWYDFKVRIMKGTALMRELTISARTALDDAGIPAVEIDYIQQDVGSNTVKVFWDAPEHKEGTIYRYAMQYAETDDHDSYVDAGEVLMAPPVDGFTDLQLPALDKMYYVRVRAYYEMDGEQASKWSEPVPVWMYSKFEWDTPKVKGQPFSLTSAEWNKLIDAVETRLGNAGIDDYFCDAALKGKPVTAEHFNQACLAISTFNEVGMPMQEHGNNITADMLNLLEAKVNME